MTAPTRDDVERTLLRFIVDELLDEQYDGSDPLAADVVDSLGIEQLVDFIRERYGITIGDEEMIMENFRSVPALAALVDSKQRGAPPLHEPPGSGAR